MIKKSNAFIKFKFYLLLKSVYISYFYMSKGVEPVLLPEYFSFFTLASVLLLKYRTWIRLAPCGAAGRCVRSFSVRVINSTCVSLMWTLLENSSVPQFMVVQWSPRRHQGSGHHHKLQGGDTWARLPYTDGPAYLRGNSASAPHFLLSFVPELRLKVGVSPPQVISLLPTTTTTTCTPCLQTERASLCSPQVGTGGHYAFFFF